VSSGRVFLFKPSYPIFTIQDSSVDDPAVCQDILEFSARALVTDGIEL
jgi:hypothetical protein